MKVIYPAVFHKEKDSYWVEFPDLVGCQSFGDGIEDTFDNAREALYAYCITLLEDGNRLPDPSDMQTAIKQAAEEDETCFCTFVDVSLSARNKSVKKTLTIPSWMNEVAERANINFSAVLQEALMQKLNLK